MLDPVGARGRHRAKCSRRLTGRSSGAVAAARRHLDPPTSVRSGPGRRRAPPRRPARPGCRRDRGQPEQPPLGAAAGVDGRGERDAEPSQVPQRSRPACDRRRRACRRPGGAAPSTTTCGSPPSVATRSRSEPGGRRRRRWWRRRDRGARGESAARPRPRRGPGRRSGRRSTAGSDQRHAGRSRVAGREAAVRVPAVRHVAGAGGDRGVRLRRRWRRCGPIAHDHARAPTRCSRSGRAPPASSGASVMQPDRPGAEQAIERRSRSGREQVARRSWAPAQRRRQERALEVCAGSNRQPGGGSASTSPSTRQRRDGSASSG